MKFDTIKKRNDFKEVCKKGLCIYQPSFVLRFMKHDEFIDSKVGFIVTKRNGNAVERNTIKRRLRHAIDENVKYFQLKGIYIFIAKKELLIIKHLDLQESIIFSLNKLNKMLGNLYI